jgi:hypothetical protein
MFALMSYPKGVKWPSCSPGPGEFSFGLLYGEVSSLIITDFDDALLMLCPESMLYYPGAGFLSGLNSYFEPIVIFLVTSAPKAVRCPVCSPGPGDFSIGLLYGDVSSLM